MLDKNEIATVLTTMAGEVFSEFSAVERIALVGIRDRGEILAGRLAKLLQSRSMAVDLGTLDITLYRDDLNQKGTTQPTVRVTEIDFDIDGQDIILVDDVLWTGRTIRAVSRNDSPFDKLDAFAVNSIISALSRLTARAKLVRVRVLSSKNKFTTTLPRNAGAFLIDRLEISLKPWAV